MIIHHGDQLITVQDVDGNDVEVAVHFSISVLIWVEMALSFIMIYIIRLCRRLWNISKKKMILSPKLILPIIRIRKSAGWQVCLQVTRSSPARRRRDRDRVCSPDPRRPDAAPGAGGSPGPPPGGAELVVHQGE